MEQNLSGITNELIRDTLAGFNPIAHTLNEMCPGAQFTIRGYRYSDIEWSSSNVHALPAKDHLEEAIRLCIENKTKYNTYGPLRRDAYPSLSDQLDMLYWDNVNGTRLWADAITQIKATFPKLT
jgi:hypothetical protein